MHECLGILALLGFTNFSSKDRQSGLSAQLRNINLPRCITKTKSWTKQPEETLKLSDSTGVAEHHTKLQQLIYQQDPLDCSCPIMFLTYAWNYEIQCSSTTVVRFSFGAWPLVTAEKTEVCFAKVSKMKVACWCCTKLPSSMHWRKNPGYFPMAPLAIQRQFPYQNRLQRTDQLDSQVGLLGPWKAVAQGCRQPLFLSASAGQAKQHFCLHVALFSIHCKHMKDTCFIANFFGVQTKCKEGAN